MGQGSSAGCRPNTGHRWPHTRAFVSAAAGPIGAAVFAASGLRWLPSQDGTRPVLPVPADQRWFWTERWQGMEREADAAVAAGRERVFNGPDEMFEYLDSALID